MNYRPTAWLREQHDMGTCPELCPMCARIDAFEVEPREAHDYLVTSDYREER